MTGKEEPPNYVFEDITFEGCEVMTPDNVAIRFEARAHQPNDPANPTAGFGFRLEFMQDCRRFQGFDPALSIYSCRTIGKNQASEVYFWIQRQSGKNPPDV